MGELNVCGNTSLNIPNMKVIDVERAIQQKLKEDWVEPQHETTHQFFAGVYVRTLSMPKGTLMTGARHRLKTCNMLLRGSVSVFMEDGSGVTTVTAPCVFESEKYIKKLVYCHEDVLFTTVHPTDETNIEKLEEMFTISEDEYMREVRV